MERLSDIGEDALIERLTSGLPAGPGVVVGVGDDCAVLESLDSKYFDLLKVDCVVEGIHFEKTAEPEAAGWKAVCRPLSDVAAMGGGTVRGFLVNLAVPPDEDPQRIEGWYRGFHKASQELGAFVVGGEMASLPGSSAMISVSLLARIDRDRCVLRSGARVGDCIAVTGRLGGSLESGRHLSFRPRLDEAAWLTGNFKLHAMMDLSDGLARDLPRLAKASGVGYRLDFDRVPLHGGCNLRAGLSDGEDYELLFTFSAEQQERLEDQWPSRFPGTPLTVIGEITETVETPVEGGWDHFEK